MKTDKHSLLVLTLTLLAATTVRAATITVTSTADSGVGTLRSAVTSANPGDTIVFNNTLSSQTITLTGGEILLNKNLTVDGSALANQIVLNGNHASRIFTVNAGVNVTLTALTITNGYVLGVNGVDGVGSGNGSNGGDGNGGGIYNISGTLTVNNCTLANNVCVGGNGGYGGVFGGVAGSGGRGAGGSIYNGGTLTVNNCALANNNSSGGGGGYGAGARVNGIGRGGGIYNSGGTLNVNNSTFANNFTQYGGAIYNLRTINLKQSTFTGNIANSGGAVAHGSDSGTANLIQCTLVLNHSTGTNLAQHGGGAIDSSGIVSLTNCIVAGNTAATGQGPDLWTVNSRLTAFYCLIGDNTSSTVTNGINGNLAGNASSHLNPLLAPLGNYGGPTQTMQPLPGSPAIDAGDDVIASSLSTDQRGLSRLSGPHVDIGAAEFQVPVIVVTNSPVLTDLILKSNGEFSFHFTNLAGTSFTTLTSTNVALPFSNWISLGSPTEGPAGQFQFSDLQATNYSQRYYRVKSP